VIALLKRKFLKFELRRVMAIFAYVSYPGIGAERSMTVRRRIIGCQGGASGKTCAKLPLMDQP
jgi:hypothetical protein